MSTNLQHRALRSEPEAVTLNERTRSTSMVVPIDRSARDRTPVDVPEVIELAPVLSAQAVAVAVGPAWRSIAAIVVTGLLLIPVLVVALFPVSILALTFAPVAAVLYASVVGFGRDERGSGVEANEEAVVVSRAA